MTIKKNIPSESYTLLAGLAHKINTPLKSVLLSSQKLIDTYKSKDFEYISYKDFKHILTTLEQMNKEINRCCLTTQRLLHLEKSHLQDNNTDLNQTIHEILDLLQQQMAALGIRTDIQLKKESLKVALSRVDGHQVIHNLLSNAIQAMPAGGTVKIRTSFDAKAKQVKLEITDEGVGISPKHLPKVFEPFFTTHDQGVDKSSGLGLSIVQSIVTTAGGTIAIHSSLRKGTQVKISLPVVDHD